MNRRQFHRVCSGLVLSATALPVSGDSTRTAHARSALHTVSGEPVTPASLTPGKPYLFFYPYLSTPCFLIDLGTAAEPQPDTVDQWRGGVGPQRSIVAYSAICSHKMSHPAREISFINYRHDAIEYYNSEAGKSEKRARLISCCSERSVYDPADGARVLSGPAPQPLAKIELQTDPASSQLLATASYGADMYERFFEKFGFRAALEHKLSDVRTPTGKSATLHLLEDYSRQTIAC